MQETVEEVVHTYVADLGDEYQAHEIRKYKRHQRPEGETWVLYCQELRLWDGTPLRYISDHEAEHPLLGTLKIKPKASAS